MKIRYYELTFLTKPEATEEEAKKITENIKKFIEENKGKVDKILPPKQEVFFPAGKKPTENVLLCSLTFYFDPALIENLKKSLDSQELILRYILFQRKAPKTETPTSPQKTTIEKKETPSPTAKPKKVELKELDKKIEEILKE